MGFNYLQTDDRDDYLSQFGRKNKTKICSGITLISPSGEKLFDNVPYFKVRSYCKKTYLPVGNGGKKIWRNTLLSRNYQVITNYVDVTS